MDALEIIKSYDLLKSHGFSLAVDERIGYANNRVDKFLKEGVRLPKGTMIGIEKLGHNRKHNYLSRDVDNQKSFITHLLKKRTNAPTEDHDNKDSDGETMLKREGQDMDTQSIHIEHLDGHINAES